MSWRNHTLSETPTVGKVFAKKSADLHLRKLKEKAWKANAIPISKLKPSYRQLDILLFVVFVTSWCVNGFMDYHLRSVSDTAIEVAMQNTATTFTGGDICTVTAVA